VLQTLSQKLLVIPQVQKIKTTTHGINNNHGTQQHLQVVDRQSLFTEKITAVTITHHNVLNNSSYKIHVAYRYIAQTMQHLHNLHYLATNNMPHYTATMFVALQQYNFW
jgi:hypothetical protein